MLEASGKYWLGNKPSRRFRNLTVWWGNPTRRLEASPRNPGPSAFLRPGQHLAAKRAAPGARLPPDPRGSAAARWAAGVTRAPRNGRPRAREEGAPAARAVSRALPGLLPAGGCGGRCLAAAAQVPGTSGRNSHPRASPLRSRPQTGRVARQAGPQGGRARTRAPGIPASRSAAPRTPVVPRGSRGEWRPRPRGSRSPARAAPRRSGGRPERDGGAAGFAQPSASGCPRAAAGRRALQPPRGFRAARGRVPGGEGRLATVPRRAALSPAAVPAPAAPACFTRSGCDGAQVEASALPAHRRDPASRAGISHQGSEVGQGQDSELPRTLAPRTPSLASVPGVGFTPFQLL